MTTEQTLQSIADVLAANEQHLVPLDPNRPKLHWRDITGLPTPRPVPSPEDRMRDARTDTPHTIDPAPTHPGRSFRTWMSDTDRDQLDAEVGRLQGELDEMRDARDVAEQVADFRQGVIDRHRQELGAAGEVLAVVRDAAERIDRALAVYDTTPEQEPAERENDGDAQDAIEELTEAVRGALADGTQGERVEAIRDLLEGWYANWPETAVTDPNEPLAWELAGLIAAAEARASAPSSVPPRRAQELPTAAHLAEHLYTYQWYSKPEFPLLHEPSAHREHHYNSDCAICRGDLSRIAAVALAYVQARP